MKINKNDILRLLGVVVIVMIMATSAVVWAINLSSNSNVMTYEQAMKEKLPAVVMFHSPHCSFCVKFMPVLKDLAQEYKGKYNFVTVDTEKKDNYPLSMEYRIGSLPSLYIVDPTIDNRIYINPTFYMDKSFVKLEMDRYLRIRALIKQ